jgi:acyl-CoA synthetase (NDP forming)
VSTAVAPAVTGVRDLDALFDPRSVAVVGASDDPAKWGHHLAVQLLRAPGGRAVHLVNRKGGTVLGQTALTRLRDAGTPVDLVAICVPAAGFLDAVDDALESGARAIVGITAGLSEASPEGRAIELEALRRVRAAGAVLVGPNCLGVIDTTSSLFLASEPFTAGEVAVLSQSGNLVIDVDDLLAARGLGISRFVSLGNQADVSLAELMHACVDHAGTRAVAVYAEDVHDGRAFVAASRALARAGKPVVLLAPGRSAAASRGAASHTGSLTSPARVVDAACAAGRVHRVETPHELVDALVGLVGPRRATGRRIAVLTDGGGHGAIAADAVTAVGLEVPQLSGQLGARLRAALWQQSTVSNPVDLAGVGEQDPSSYARGVAALLASDEVDAVLLVGYFGGYAHHSSSLAAAEVRAAREIVDAVTAQSKPVVVHSIFPSSESVQVLAAAGIPVHRGFAEAARSLAALCATPSTSSGDPLDLPAPAAALSDVGYVETRELLASYGVPFPALSLVSDEARLSEVLGSGDLRFPVVLKAMGLLHKSDAGGVVLGLRDHDSAVAAYRDLVARLDPPAVTVEEMADLGSGVEVIVGVQRDARFGPVVMVGLGGVLTEVLADVAFALAPVSVATARELLSGLRGATILDGVRGRPAVDVAALAEVVAAVSRAAAEHPEIGELEVNPVLAGSNGCLALDARAVPVVTSDPH